jgi:hypothetical protein
MQVTFSSVYGRITWTLPPDATYALGLASPELREQTLEAFGSNLTILCGAMLKGFGNPGVVQTLNLIMQEVQEIIRND